MKNYILILFIAIAGSSCTITKAKKSINADSTHVQKADSGRINQTSNVNKNDSVWKREIIYFGKDTITNNYYTTPAVIYRESGAQSKQTAQQNTQANWNKASDSSNVKTVVVEKEKKEQASNIWQILGLSALISVVLIVLSKLKISLK